jgi:CheY-like chemotaxis protein
LGKGLATMSVSMTMPILIVDDYNTMIRIMRNLLRQLGFTNIDEANDGAAALAKMRNKDYALVISDSHEPDDRHGILAARSRRRTDCSNAVRNGRQ